MLELKEITDKKIMEFTDTSDRTLRNWKKPTQIIGDTKIYAPVGKHNLYKGAKLATYLLDYKQYLDTDEEDNPIEVSEPLNNLESMLQSINTISNLTEIVENNCNNKYIKDLKEEVEELKNKLEDLQKLIIL